ncbi:MAG: hypothetical protein ACPF9D_13575, partial [Owenweeksia sp.]
MLYRHIAFLFLLWALSSCGNLGPLPANSSDQALYQQAIASAMSPEPDKVYDQLVPITRVNSQLQWKEFNGEDYLLVVSWKGSDAIYRPYLDSAFFPTQKWPIWITTAPQLLDRMHTEQYTDTNKRLLQML